MTTMSKEELQKQIKALQTQLAKIVKKEIQEKIPVAIPYNSIDWKPLYEILIDHIVNIRTKSNHENEPLYIFEKAVVAVYGRDIWAWYNKQKE